jgi:hypothetical protein
MNGKLIKMHGGGLTSAQRSEGRASLDQAFQPVIAELEKYQMPEEKLNAIVDHAVNLLCGNPDMKPHRIARKTAKFFKLKTAQNGSSKV